MKRTAVKTVAVLCAAIMITSIVACKNGGEENSHGQTPESTVEFFDAAGNTQYKLLIPEQVKESMQYAVDEFQRLLIACYPEADAVQVVNDAAFSDFDGKYISLGETALRKQQGESATYEELGTDGYKIKTYKNSVLLFGYSERSVIYSVYGLFEKLFGYRLIASDQLYFKNAGKAVGLPAMEVVEIPSFTGRQLDWYTVSSSGGDLGFNYKLNSPSSCYKSKFGESSEWSAALYPGHTALILLPLETYQAEHSDWYYSAASGRVQLCLASDEMRAELVKNLKNYIISEPAAKIFMVGQEDTLTNCQCSFCSEEIEKYKASGYWIRFVNKVAREIKSWLETNEDEALRARADIVKIATFSYNQTEQAPVKFNPVTKAYDPIVEEETGKPIHTEDNVIIMLAPIDMNLYYPITDEVNNQKYYQWLNQWKMISDHFAVWLYGSPSTRLHLVDYLHTMSSNLKTFKDYGVEYCLYAGSFASAATPFYELKVYILSQLLWNVDADVNELIDEFFEAYYQEASEPMKNYYQYLKARWVKVASEWEGEFGQKFEFVARSSSNKYTLDELKYLYTQGFLTQCEKLLNNAIYAVEKTEDEQRRELIYNRVLSETLAYRYLRFALYNNTMGKEELSDEITTWKKDADIVGLTWMTLDKSTDEMYAYWMSGEYTEYLF